MISLVSEHQFAKSTIRNYQEALKSFCDYLIRPDYHWVRECEDRFGEHPTQICFEWNTRAHLTDYEGHADRRPMTRDEVQAIFDFADGQVDEAIRAGRKGALAAYRDATLFKTMYAYGLRCNEAAKLDVTDWYRNAKAPCPIREKVTVIPGRHESCPIWAIIVRENLRVARSPADQSWF